MVLNTTLFNQLGGSEKDIEDLIQQGTGSPAISLNSTKYENIRLSSVGGYFFWTGVWSELSLPNCTYITTCAFGRMTKLTSITLPWSKITVIGQSAFGSNTLLQLDSIECPICSYVGSNAFSSCLGLTEVNFSTATTIYTSAFTGCLNLKYANFPSATTIQPYAFHNCQKLISAYFGAATTIQSEIFRNCYKLENISMPKLQVIGSRAVGYCSSLKSVYLPSGRYFNQYAFEYDTYLNTFVINQGSTSAAYFGQYTFGHCYRLKSLYLLGASVISLANTNVFLSTPISTYTNYTGGVNGSIYVPSSLYATYIASNIWSTYAARFVSMTDQEIEDFLNNPIDVEAQFTQGNNIIYSGASLDTLIPYLKVYAISLDGKTEVSSSNYTLSGTLTRGKETIIVTYQTFTTTFTCLVYDEIVSGYGRVKYIQTSGAQRINTGISLPNIKYVEADVQCITAISDTSTPSKLMGCGSDNNNFVAAVEVRVGMFRWRWGFNSYKDFSVTITDIHTLTVTIPAIYSVGSDTATVTCDESSGTVQKGQSYAITNITFVIFGYNTPSGGPTTNAYQNKLYELVLKDVNGNYLFNGIPAIRMSDKVAGIYDQATNTFFPSDTSTNFLYA